MTIWLIFLLAITVIAIDIDPKKIEMAKHNAEIYGVADRIEFIVGDFFDIAPFLKADVVFLSPPWGGPEYLAAETFSLNKILEPYGGIHIFQTARKISENVAYYLPRNVNVDEVSIPQIGWQCAIKFIYLSFSRVNWVVKNTQILSIKKFWSWNYLFLLLIAKTTRKHE